MAFKVQDGFQFSGGNIFVSGKRKAYYISQIGHAGAALSGTITSFTTGSVPTNWSHNTSSHSTTSQFTDSTDGDYFLIKGNATGNSYPLRYTLAFQGDWLFQLSFYASLNPTYQDWGMALSNTIYTDRTQNSGAASDIPWKWRWGSNADDGTFTYKRIAMQCDGDNAKIYPNLNSNTEQPTGSNVDTTGGSSGAFFTLHFQHRTTTNQVKAKVTAGSKIGQHQVHN